MKSGKRCVLRRLPPELLLQLETISKVPNKQDDILCTVHPKGNYAVKWNRPLEILPYPHRLRKDSRTKSILLNVLNTDNNRVLTLQCSRGGWRRKHSSSLYWFAGILKRTGHADSKGQSPSATASQLRVLSELFGIPLNQLPPLTKSNAAIFIDTASMPKYSQCVNVLIQIWLSKT